MAIIENWVVHNFLLSPLFICLISGGSVPLFRFSGKIPDTVF